MKLFSPPKRSKRISKDKQWFPDKGDIIERQQLFVFIYVSFGFLAGIALYLLTDVIPHQTLFTVVHSLQAAYIITLLVLCSQRILKVRTALLLLFISIQVSLSLDTLHITIAPENGMGIPEVLGLFLLLSILIPLSITIYWRPLPYILTAVTLGLYAACTRLTRDVHMEMMQPLMFMSMIVLTLMGDKLMRVINSLHRKEREVSAKQKMLLEFLNMDEAELLELIKLFKNETLSQKQSARLLNLLDEQTRTMMLKAAVEVVEKRQRNAAALDALELGLTAYERKVALMIVQEKTTPEIAASLRKSVSAITSARTSIRTKLGIVTTGDDLRATLLKRMEGNKKP